MSSFATYMNKKCAACLQTEPLMVQVGAVYMCEKCFKTHFTTEDPMSLEKETYLRFLNAQNNTDNKSVIINQNEIECQLKHFKVQSSE